MNKGIRLLKRLMALFLVLIFCIESFGAVVSDNDGSSFITKAEFDSLKNNFQSQIDQYNTSIDSKIDGAIASYLAGINISKTETRNTFYSPNEGVLSLENSSFPWVEGLMGLNVYGALVRYSRTNAQGAYFFTMNNTGISPFYETLIDDVSDTGFANFNGYRRTKQYYVGSGQRGGPYTFQQKDYTTVVGVYAGYQPLSNTVLTEDSSVMLLQFGVIGNVFIDNYYSYNQLYLYGNQSSFRREILDDNDLTFGGGLILNSNSLEHKFNNYEIKDWCNDTLQTSHTETLRLSDLNINGSGTAYWMTSGSEATVTDSTFDTSNYYTFDTGGGGGERRKPYFGFANHVGNWNKIYVKDLDSNYNNILLSSDSNKSVNTITNASKNHIKLGAGMPVIDVKLDDKVTYEFNFKDKTKDYAVFIKIGSFDSSKNLADDKTDVITNFTVFGDTEYVDAWKGLKIKNGVGKCTFQADKDGVVFMKWCWASGISSDGGGILYPAKTVLVESQ